jgi:hypothetical protein
MSRLLDQDRSHVTPALPRGARRSRSVLVLGAAGSLGSAVLEHLLADPHGAPVFVATRGLLNVGIRGLHEVRMDSSRLPAAVHADCAVLVYDRPRFSNGRDDAFWTPQPQDLLAVARWLRANGIGVLVVVMPHAPSSLPEALKQGLANLDEEAVSMLDFERLLFVRSAQRPAGSHFDSRLERLAHWMLSQLRLMVPQREQPVRPAKVAAFVCEALAQLPRARPGTWVARPELVWEASQTQAVDELVQRWLDLQP